MIFNIKTTIVFTVFCNKEHSSLNLLISSVFHPPIHVARPLECEVHYPPLGCLYWNLICFCVLQKFPFHWLYTIHPRCFKKQVVQLLHHCLLHFFTEFFITFHFHSTFLTMLRNGHRKIIILVLWFPCNFINSDNLGSSTRIMVLQSSDCC